MNKVVLASNNPKKSKELISLLQGIPIEIHSQSEFNLPSVAETGLTFVENALIKARYAAEKTGLPAIADDSGLSVDALSGQPGIYSSRYAGEQASDQDNYLKLLSEMSNVATPQRGAEFFCVVVFMRHANDPTPVICQGQWRGSILPQAQGDAGFGYDPVFYVQQFEGSAAQLTPDQKNQLSHRGQALKQLISFFRQYYG